MVKFQIISKQRAYTIRGRIHLDYKKQEKSDWKNNWPINTCLIKKKNYTDLVDGRVANNIIHNFSQGIFTLSELIVEI